MPKEKRTPYAKSRHNAVKGLIRLGSRARSRSPDKNTQEAARILVSLQQINITLEEEENKKLLGEITHVGETFESIHVGGAQRGGSTAKAFVDLVKGYAATILDQFLPGASSTIGTVVSSEAANDVSKAADNISKKIITKLATVPGTTQAAAKAGVAAARSAAKKASAVAKSAAEKASAATPKTRKAITEKLKTMTTDIRTVAGTADTVVAASISNASALLILGVISSITTAYNITPPYDQALQAALRTILTVMPHTMTMLKGMYNAGVSVETMSLAGEIAYHAGTGVAIMYAVKLAFMTVKRLGSVVLDTTAALKKIFTESSEIIRDAVHERASEDVDTLHKNTEAFVKGFAETLAKKIKGKGVNAQKKLAEGKELTKPEVQDALDVARAVVEAVKVGMENIENEDGMAENVAAPASPSAAPASPSAAPAGSLPDEVINAIENLNNKVEQVEVEEARSRSGSNKTGDPPHSPDHTMGGGRRTRRKGRQSKRRRTGRNRR